MSLHIEETMILNDIPQRSPRRAQSSTKGGLALCSPSNCFDSSPFISDMSSYEGRESNDDSIFSVEDLHPKHLGFESEDDLEDLLDDLDADMIFTVDEIVTVVEVIQQNDRKTKTLSYISVVSQN